MQVRAGYPAGFTDQTNLVAGRQSLAHHNIHPVQVAVK
jgi:hypothetical protein